MRSSFIAVTIRPVVVLASLALAIGAVLPRAFGADTTPSLLDDFSDASVTRTGAVRMVIDDKAIGGSSSATVKCENGTFIVRGELIPGRGAPAFISVPLLLAPAGEPGDASGFQGVRLRVKVIEGALSVQVASAAIDNFDFHTSAPIVRSPDAWQEIRIDFKDLKRAWSEQIALDLEGVTSVNLVAAGMARGTFAYEVDEIGFY